MRAFRWSVNGGLERALLFKCTSAQLRSCANGSPFEKKNPEFGGDRRGSATLCSGGLAIVPFHWALSVVEHLEMGVRNS